MEVGGRKELKPVLLPKPEMGINQHSKAVQTALGFKVTQEICGSRWIEKGFLSISLECLRLEDSWHVGLGCEAMWQGSCWLRLSADLCQVHQLHLVMQQVCFLTRILCA